MKVADFIKRYLSAIFLALAVLCLALSVFAPSASYDAESMASHVSRRMDRRLAKLDSYASQLLLSPAENGVWPVINAFPEDMVIYRYQADTLHSWYNVLATKPSLELLSDAPSFEQYGRKWYIVRLLSQDDCKILTALMVKDEDKINVARGINGISANMHIHGRYDVAPLDSDDGAVVKVRNTPVMRVVVSDTISDENSMGALGFRWLALLMIICGSFSQLAFHRSAPNCLKTIAVLLLAAVISRYWADGLSEYTQIFSPTLYAHDGILNSFGLLLIFNAISFLIFLAMFMCRDMIADYFSRSRRSSVIYMVTLVVMLATAVFYTFYTLISIVNNSGITLELYRINVVSGFSFMAYFSYAFLSVGILLLIECALCMINRLRNTSLTMLHIAPMTVFAAVAASGILLTVTVLGFEKEESRVRGWSNRIAVDRNLSFEMALRAMEPGIADDQVIDVLCHNENSEQLVLRRLMDHFGRLQSQCDISVRVATDLDDQLREYMGGLLVDGVSVGPDSHFIYNRNAVKGNYYTGVFPYYSEENGHANLIVEVVPRATENFAVPPSYSYARYMYGRLSSFSGNYAYPTVLKQGLASNSRTSFVENGYRHFVNKVNDEEIIIISRSEERFNAYFITFTFLVFTILLLLSFFRHRERKQKEASSRFGRRMLTLAVASLSVTLIVMAFVSVLFVSQRNERNMTNVMSGRISSIQIMLDEACRTCVSSDELQTTEFLRVLDEISRNTSSSLDIYSPEGNLVVSTMGRTQRRLAQTRSLISPEAYRSIILENHRYYIEQIASRGRGFYILYAPIINASGHIIGIASSPYFMRDYDYTRDVVLHAATIISFFLILLFMTVIITSSIVKAIFRPLVVMGEKMDGTDARNLELLEYDGNDEITSLVQAYNNMVLDLRESTGKLAAAERDKAWSEMARQVAHEIKNPLTPIKLEIQRLQRLKQKNDPNWERKFDTVSAIVLEHIDILSQTANEFSTFAKLYSEPSIEIDLDKTLREQIMLFEGRGVDITYLGVEGVTVMGPKPQLIRVFVNLLTNALQAVEGVDDPKIMVSMRKGDDMWDIVFEDNGPGVSEENISRLFTPNFTTKSSGTGLGLAICRSIVDRCGGTISYSKSFTLSGACFTVSIPA